MALVAGGASGATGAGRQSDDSKAGQFHVKAQTHTSWLMPLSLPTAESRSICRDVEGHRSPAQGFAYPRDDLWRYENDSSRLSHSSQSINLDSSANPDSKPWSHFLASPREFSVREARTMAEICPQTNTNSTYSDPGTQLEAVAGLLFQQATSVLA